MFCAKCGKPMNPGDEFCVSCGTTARAQATQPQQQPAQGVQQKPAGTGAAAFFSSPGGIVLIIAVVCIVIAGIVVGVILGTRDGGNAAYEEGITEAWEGFLSNVSETDNQVSPVADLAALAANSAPVAQFSSSVAQSRSKNSSNLNKLLALNPPSNQVTAYDHLVQALKDYDSYLKKSQEFLNTYAANPNDPNLGPLLTDMQNLASAINTHVNGFLQKSGISTASPFNPSILQLASAYVPQLAAVQQALANQAAQQAANQAAQQAAQQQQNQVALENAVFAYLETNWLPFFPYEQAWIEEITWSNDEHTSAIVKVGVQHVDASTTNTTVYATKSGGVWVISESHGGSGRI